jgi:hypothetical protein
MRLLLCASVFAIAAAQVAWAESFPADAGAINVRDYGARGDGLHDDTEALLRAIAASGEDAGPSFWQDRPVYLPDGIYLVSAPLLKRYANGGFASGLILVGQSEAHTIIRLADHAAGFGDPAQARGVVFTTSKHLDGTPTSGGKDYPRLGEGNDAYMNFVEDLTIDVGHGNPGAIGIDYLANNLGALRRVTLTAPADSGAVGLSMTRKWPGPALIDGLTVRGFDVGISVAQTEYGLTMAHLRLVGQRTGAIRNLQNALTISDLNVEGPAPAIVNDGDEGFIAIDGGMLNLAGDGARAIRNNGMMVLRGLAVTGTDGHHVLSGTLRAGVPIASGQDPGRRVDIPEPQPQPVAAWASVARFGAAADGAQVATDGLRRAFASGAATIYLPHGTYLVDDALDIPASVTRIVGMNSTIHVSPRRQPGFSRAGGIMRVVTAGEPLSIEGLAFDNTNQGDQLAVEVSGARDVVLRDIVSAGVGLLDRKPEGGRVFLEDVCCGRMRVAGPRPVAARQFDTEGGGTRIVNQGTWLTIEGLKTEGICTIVDNRDGAQTDIFGGLVYMVRDPQGADVPAFRNQSARLSAAFAEEVLQGSHRYDVYLEQDGMPRAVAASTFPPRGLGRFVPDLTADSRPSQ